MANKHKYTMFEVHGDTVTSSDPYIIASGNDLEKLKEKAPPRWQEDGKHKAVWIEDENKEEIWTRPGSGRI